MKNEVAIFGTGCFWCTEAIFKKLKGVVSTEVGYAGGVTQNPDYESVSRGESGHAEVVRIVFDPKVISYEQLLDVFWKVHDPTSLNRQGNDVGTQYRSLIIYTSGSQKEAAEKAKNMIKDAITEIKELDKFWPAEDYHTNYFAKHSSEPYCQLVIAPKLEHFEKEFDQSKDLF